MRPEHQDALEPLVVSWDWGEGRTFAERHRYQGTRDPAAYLAVSAAIEFQAEHGWDEVRERCRGLAERARMVSVPLPPCDAAKLQRRLYEEHRIEIYCPVWQDRPFLRASFQGYNDESDLDRLLEALKALL